MAKRNAKHQRLEQQGALNRHPERVRATHFQCGAFFDPHDLVQVKYEMLRSVTHEGASKIDAAQQFGLSRPTFYQAEAAFARDGIAGLLPRQRGPKGAHKLTDEVMAFIVARRAEDPALHARALARLVDDELGLTVHPRSIERALARKKNASPSLAARFTGRRAHRLRAPSRRGAPRTSTTRRVRCHRLSRPTPTLDRYRAHRSHPWCWIGCRQPLR